jgi:hypothetical protein
MRGRGCDLDAADGSFHLRGQVTTGACAILSTHTESGYQLVGRPLVNSRPGWEHRRMVLFDVSHSNFAI